jgi:hypothetical protein
MDALATLILFAREDPWDWMEVYRNSWKTGKLVEERLRD